MAKQTTQPAGHQAQRAARKPSKGTTAAQPATPAAAPAQPATPPAQPATAMQALASVVQGLASTMQAGLPTPATPAPVTVALRGGLAIAQVKLAGKPYRVGAPHNNQWWQAVQATIAAGNGVATVQALQAAGVPNPFIGYTVRRGYLQAVAPGAAQ